MSNNEQLGNLTHYNCEWDSTSKITALSLYKQSLLQNEGCSALQSAFPSQSGVTEQYDEFKETENLASSYSVIC